MTGEIPEVHEALAVYAAEAPETERVPPGYKLSEVGVIPEDWETVSLEELSFFITKGSTPTTYGFGWVTEGILFLRSECVSQNGLDLTQSMFISAEAHTVLRRSEVHEGDLLITITGNVGRVVCLTDLTGSANINQHIARIRVVPSEAHAGFVFHFLSQPKVRRYYGSITTGQAYPQISLQQVRETKIHLPPLPEQRAIAAALSDVDALISALDRLIAKKRAVKTAAMQQLLTGKQRLPGFSGEWEVKRLGNIGSFSKGKGLAKHELSSSGELPAIPYTAIYTDLDEVVESSNLVNFVSSSSGAVIINSPHLLIAGSSNMLENIGKVTAFKDYADTVIGGDIILYKTSADVVFLSYLLNTRPHRESIISLSQGSTIRHVYAATFRDYEVSLPGIEEQTAIAAVLSDMDAEITALEARREKTRRIKQGMMQELLTGRTRLV